MLFVINRLMLTANSMALTVGMVWSVFVENTSYASLTLFFTKWLILEREFSVGSILSHNESFFDRTYWLSWGARRKINSTKTRKREKTAGWMLQLKRSEMGSTGYLIKHYRTSFGVSEIIKDPFKLSRTISLFVYCLDMSWPIFIGFWPNYWLMNGNKGGKKNLLMKQLMK